MAFVCRQVVVQPVPIQVLHRVLFSTSNCYEVEWTSFKRYEPIAKACMQADLCDITASINSNAELVSLSIVENFDEPAHKAGQHRWHSDRLAEALQEAVANVSSAEPINEEVWGKLLSGVHLD